MRYRGRYILRPSRPLVTAMALGLVAICGATLVTAQSIVPTPEPGSLVLLGAGLIAISTLLRQKFSAVNK